MEKILRTQGEQESFAPEHFERMEQAVEAIRKEAHEELRKKFGPDGESPMDYHVEDHTNDVERGIRDRVRLIHQFDPTLISKEEELLLEAEASAHDIVQDFTRGKDGNRLRRRGPNEEASATWLLDRLGQYPGVFSMPEAEIRADIEVTEPDFKFEGGGPNLFHHKLTPQSPLRRLLLADTDLRGAVSDPNPQKFIESGTAEWRELNIWIGEAVKDKEIEEIDLETRTKIAESFLEWRSTQDKFAMHQARHLKNTLEENEELKKSSKAAEIKQAFYNFYLENIEGNENAAKEYYGDLLMRMGAVPREGEDADAYKARRAEILRGYVSDDGNFKMLLKEMGYIPKEQNRGKI